MQIVLQGYLIIGLFLWILSLCIKDGAEDRLELLGTLLIPMIWLPGVLVWICTSESTHARWIQEWRKDGVVEEST